MGFGRSADDRDDAATRPTANGDQGCASLCRHEHVSLLHAGRAKAVGCQTEQVVGARVSVTRREPIRVVGRPSPTHKSLRDKGQAFDADVSTRGESRPRDQGDLAIGGDRVDLSAQFIRRDQVAAKGSERLGRDGQTAFEGRRRPGDDLHRAIAVDGEDGGLAAGRPCHEQPVVEGANRVECDAIESRHSCQIGERSRLVARRIDTGDSDRHMQAEQERLVGSEAALRSRHVTAPRDGEVRLGACVFVKTARSSRKRRCVACGVDQVERCRSRDHHAAVGPRTVDVEDALDLSPLLPGGRCRSRRRRRERDPGCADRRGNGGHPVFQHLC